MEDFRRGGDRSREDDIFFRTKCFFPFLFGALRLMAKRVRREIKGSLEKKQSKRRESGRVFVDDEGEGATARAGHG